MKTFLRSGADYLEQAVLFSSKRAAIAEFRWDAKELARFGQTHTASLHIASSKGELVEYPDYVLSLGPKGGVVIERA